MSHHLDDIAELNCFGIRKTGLDRLAETTPAWQRAFVVMGLMSDAQELIANGASEEARKFLNRSKYLTSKWYAVHPSEAHLVKVPAAVGKKLADALENEARNLRSQAATAFFENRHHDVARLGEEEAAIDGVLTQLRPRNRKAA